LLRQRRVRTQVPLEEIDLAQLARSLRARAGHPARGWLHGKTELRDGTVALLGCSQLEAEHIVDTMIARGILQYDAPPEDPEGTWRPRPSLA
jgi:hypothetical protein